MSPHNVIDVVVTQVVELNSLIKRFHFERPDGQPLPAFSGGAHVIVEFKDDDGVTRRTPYSLMSSPLDTRDYQISVRRDDEGRGGSLYLHRHVVPGMAMRLNAPVNLFPLDLRASKHLMIAGGIGITPFLAQTKQISGRSFGVLTDFELHYGIRSDALGSYVEELQARHGNRVHVYRDAKQERMDFDLILASQPAGTHVYVCGPTPMIQALLDKAREHGWPDAHVHHEHFAKFEPGEPFSVELATSRTSVNVRNEQTLLEAIEEAGIDAPYLCRGGACGQCETRVIDYDGVIEHSDHWLDEDERASNEKIMPCVSRFRGERLVLDR